MHTFIATGDNAAQQQAPMRQHGHQIKAALGAIVFPLQRARWQAFIATTPGLAALAQVHPSLLYKIYRPYASRQLGCAARVDLLRGHYRFLWQAGARPLVEYAARRALVLASIEGKDGATYRLQLTAIHDSHREGELCLRLTRDGASLYLASFLFRPQPGGAVIQLGALQGLRSPAGAQAVKEATRALHGCWLRPSAPGQQCQPHRAELAPAPPHLVRLRPGVAAIACAAHQRRQLPPAMRPLPDAGHRTGAVEKAGGGAPPRRHAGATGGRHALASGRPVARTMKTRGGVS